MGFDFWKDEKVARAEIWGIWWLLDLGKCCALPKTDIQPVLNSQVHCQGGVASHRIRAILSFYEQHPANTTRCHASTPCLITDQVEHTYDEQCPCS